MSTLAVVLSYLLGAIPFGVLIGAARGVDVRAVGSGNIGATNVWRALGPRLGATVFTLDVLKGLAAPLLARLLAGDNPNVIALCALVAVLGHTFSVFLKFRGGKGVATAFGGLLGLAPLVALGCIALWGVVLLLSRIISVASVAACLVAPAATFAAGAPLPYTAVVALFATVALLKHIPNMKRLAAGAEPRIGKRAARTSENPNEAAETPEAREASGGTVNAQ